MILKEVEDIIQAQKKEGEFIYPFYEKYCFSNIPSTILNLFHVKTKRPVLPAELYEPENPDKILVFLIDGLGYDQWLKYSKDYHLFKILNEEGLVSPITTVFPSTTAAAITTINTGLTPQEHALPEWYVYFKEVGGVIATLPFTLIGEKGQDKLAEKRVDPSILYKGGTMYQKLKRDGIKSFAFVHESYARSCYSGLVYKGSSIIPYINPSDLIVKMRKVVEKEKGPAYFYVYYGFLDAIEHEYGPHTEEYQAELSMLSFLFKKEFLDKLDRKTAKETFFIATGDHGQVNVLPEETIYLNKYRSLVNMLQTDKNKIIPPAGGPRDVFLHIKPEKLEEAFSFLAEKLEGKAEVVKISDALERGMFGIGKPKKEFLERVGNLLVLPYKNYTVWWKYFKGKKFSLLGYHGGLSKSEMLVPFASTMLSEL